MKIFFLLVSCCLLSGMVNAANAPVLGGTRGQTIIRDDAEPTIALVIERFPKEWLACHTDEECAITHVGCQKFAVNVQNAKALDKRLATVGLRADASVCPDLEANFFKDEPVARCLTEEQSVELAVLRVPSMAKAMGKTGFLIDADDSVPRQCYLDLGVMEINKHRFNTK